MSGAINFAMTDIYGGVWGTTEETIPEAADQQALPDDQKAAGAVSESGRKSVPILVAIVLFIALTVIFGGAK